MATGTLFSAPWFTVLDEDGDPVSGAKAYFYIAGTTTLTTTYSDVTLLTANANPVIADVAGRLGPVYLTPGQSVKVVLQDSTGAAIRTQDNIQAIPSSTTNVDITGTAGEALAAGKPVYLSDGSGSKTAGSWYLGDGSLPYASSLPEVGMTTAAIASGASGSIRLGGHITGLTGRTVGTPYFIGFQTLDVLSATTYPRFMGVADSTTSIIMGRDSPTYTRPLVVSAINTGATNNWEPFAAGWGDAIVLWNGLLDADAAITGIANGRPGQKVTIKNINTTAKITFAHQTTSTSGNQFFNLITSGVTPVGPGGWITYQYDGTLNWYLVDHNQGKPITPTFADSNYTGDGTDGNWALASGDVTTQTYEVRGRSVRVTWFLVTTTTVNTPSQLRIANGAWGGFTIAKSTVGTALFNANAAGVTVAWSSGLATGSVINIGKSGGGTFADFADLTDVFGEIEFEVT